ncbi:MAG: aspartate kinase [Clostridia bacterium]|nr:aspartate kinase [Clostridia bacterium]
MGLKVCKFGGTSMASAQTITAVANIINADDERRYVVVSAPGKRFSGDIKVTDLLYQCADEVEAGSIAAFKETFQKIRNRFTSIETEIGRELNIKAGLDEAENAILDGAGRDYCASRGEFLAAKIMAAVLDVPFVDATEFVRFAPDGSLDEKTFEIAAEVLKEYPRAVIPGFYGLGVDGKVKTFSRGGGDISGSIVARSVMASLYENWTDVSGFYACDPRIVNSPKWIPELTYQELRELSYMGANVLHSESIFPVRSAGIPIRICNTFSPKDKGTYIVKNSTRDMRDYVVTGVAGKKGFTSITLEKSLMNSEVGFVEKVLSVIGRRKISFEHLPSGIDTMSLVIDNEYLKDNALADLMAEMKEVAQPDKIYAHEDIALVATVGHGMAKNVGTSARLFKALSQAGINVNMIDQGSSELNIIVGVENKDCADCIRAIYEEFLGRDEDEVF